jgi:CHAT domain-containing protein
VDELATMVFMTEMYGLAKKKNISYHEAVNRVKRKFITGEIGKGKYTSPYYWAAFVYYGR